MTFNRDAEILACEVTVRYFAQRFTRNASRLAPIQYEDAVSLGWIAVVRAAGMFEPGRGLKFKTLANTSIRNELLNALKSTRSEKRWAKVVLETDFFRETGEAMSLASTAEAREDQEPSNRMHAEEILRGLPSREREILDRHYLGGETFRTIAESFGTSHQAVHKIETKALAKLRRAASRRGAVA